MKNFKYLNKHVIFMPQKTKNINLLCNEKQNMQLYKCNENSQFYDI